MARSSMTALIAHVRLMVGSPTTSEFTDDEIQNALDGHRREYRYAALDALEARTSTDVEYHDFTAHGFGYWEDDVVLTSPTYTTLTPTTSDEINGRWTFAADQADNLPVLIVGKTYDVNLAAADICDQWAAKLARDFDFQADLDEFKRSQKRAGLEAAAQTFRARGRGGSVLLSRSDWVNA